MNYNMPSYYPNPNYNYAPQIPQYQPLQTPALNGKLVDSIEMVRASEVPIGGYGVFPKGDLSGVYIKTWNNNGTTSITEFAPLTPVEPQKNLNDYSIVIEKIDSLEAKIAALFEEKNNLLEKEKEIKKYEYERNL